jgi:hypothetical protein
MPILNYTTKVPVSRTVGEIQGLLVKAGARSIMADYDGAGTVVGLSFAVESPLGLQGYTLPVRTERVLAVLERDRVEPRYSTAEQSERVACRILKDWIEAQLALLRTEMVTLDQVMLPYMRTDDGRTVYDLYLDRQLALPKGDVE